MISVLVLFCFIPEVSSYVEIPYVWTPARVVTGESYEGVVVLDEAVKTGQVVILSTSDPQVIQIPKSVHIPAHSNHGIFHIMPLREGSSQIFALVNGKMISSSISVHSSERQPEMLSIVLPANTTKTENIIGYVISTDANGTPAAVKENLIVTLSATNMIEIEKTEIKIPAGEYSVKFHAKVGGSGKIFATAKNLSVAEQVITKIHDNITVRIAVAPNIVLENSRAFFFVWLEKDGMPYKIPYVTYAYVSSSNLKSVRFNENPHIKHYGDALLRIPLIDGVGSGQLISYEPGISAVTVSIDGFGSSSTDVFVGSVNIIQNIPMINEDQVRGATPNIAMAWFYPSVTDSSAYGVIALYQTSPMTNGQQMPTKITPVPIDGRTVTLSSSGIRHPQILTLSETKALSNGIGSTHATRFEVSGISQGNHSIFVSGPGLEQYNSTLVISPAFRDSYKIKVTQIPATLGSSGDIAMISVVDDSGSLVNAKKVIPSTKFTLISGNSHTEFSMPAQNTAIHSGVLEEDYRITVFANGFAPLEAVLLPSRAASSVTLDVPPLVHKSESFPYTIHEIDSSGVPIRRLISASTSTTDGVSVVEGHVIIDEVGVENIGVVTRVGADSRSVESFANVFNVEIITNGVTNKVGKQFQLDLVGDIDDFETMIDSPFPYEKISERSFLVTPDKSGSYDITIIATRDGYASTKNTMSLYVERFVDILIRAIANDGDELNIEHQIHVGNTTKSIVTPFHEEIKPQFFHASFPPDVLVGGRGYRLNSILFADQIITDTKIERLFLGKSVEVTANYDRTVRVQVDNALGSGFYTYGAQVTLSVPPKDRVWFLIRDVFDRWEGIDSNSAQVTFTAENDISARAILREDHTFLMLVVGTAVSVTLYVNFVMRKGLDIRFYLSRQNLRNFIKTVWRPKTRSYP